VGCSHAEEERHRVSVVWVVKGQAQAHGRPAGLTLLTYVVRGRFIKAKQTIVVWCGCGWLWFVVVLYGNNKRHNP
jgi:hypothetical protein